jgi:hypothetical protein
LWSSIPPKVVYTGSGDDQDLVAAVRKAFGSPEMPRFGR